MAMKVLEERESLWRFKNLSKNLGDIEILVDFDVGRHLIKDEWESNRLAFRNYLQSGLEFKFLENSGIAGLMFQSDFDMASKEAISVGREMLQNVVEYEFSNVNFRHGGHCVSTNTIHHLYHISNFLKYRTSSARVKSVLEWGGGYGNMSKLFFEIFQDTEKYTIVDIPEFILLQYVYLSAYFGEENVRIVRDAGEIEDGINLLPVNDVVSDGMTRHDMFVSNWAISESTIFCQDFAEKNGFLDYDNLLVSYHLCGDHVQFMRESSALDARLREKGCHFEGISVIPGIHYYAIR